MGSIRDKIKSDLERSMRERDGVRTSCLRLLLAKIQNLEKRDGGSKSDDDLLAVLRGQLKRVKESVAQFEQAGRKEMAEKEKREAEIISSYLPAGPSMEQVNEALDAELEALESPGIKDMGKVMAALKERLGAGADIAQLSPLVKSRLLNSD